MECCSAESHGAKYSTWAFFKKNVSPPVINAIKLFFVTDAQDKKARVYVPVKLLGIIEKKTRVRIHNTSVSS
jgi:hypothetical protein